MTIVFTAILGESDSLKPAPIGADRCVCFVDDASRYSDARGWELTEVGLRSVDDPRRVAWHLRCVPHQHFDAYARVVWVDASFTLTDLPRLLKDAEGHALSGLRHHTRASCYEEGAELIRIGQGDWDAVRPQLETYRREGFQPKALTIGCLIVRSNDPAVAQFNQQWNAEIQQHPGDNCQLSLDYAAWKSGLLVHHLTGVRKDNPYAIHDHADHKRRRQPYRSARAIA